jgi:hypothetical protein
MSLHGPSAGTMGLMRRLLRAADGTVLIEFAYLFPILLLMILGTIELALVMFIGSSIESAILEASRYGSTGESAGGVSRQDRVLEIVADKTYGLVDMDDVELQTLVYSGFADIGQPEPYEDTNDDGNYDLGEPYSDINGNGVWDDDMGAAGLGGPSDVVVYRVEYDWGIITPLIQSVLGESVRHMSSIAVRNEPF